MRKRLALQIARSPLLRSGSEQEEICVALREVTRELVRQRRYESHGVTECIPQSLSAEPNSTNVIRFCLRRFVDWERTDPIAVWISRDRPRLVVTNFRSR